MEMNIRDVKKHFLDFEKTISYFINHIKSGNTLSKKVLERINLHQGVFYTILPSNAELAKLYEFSYGGIIPPDLDDRVEEKEYQATQLKTMDRELSEFIMNYTNASLRNYAVVENVMVEIKDKYSHIENVKVIPYNKEVYFF